MARGSIHTKSTEVGVFSSSNKSDVIDSKLIGDIKKRRGGDAIDKLREPAHHFPVHRAIRAGALTTGFASGLFGYGYMLPIEQRHLMYGVLASGLAEGNRRISRRRQGKKIEKQLTNEVAFAEEFGEPIELIKKNSQIKSRRDVQLYWGAKISSESDSSEVRERLERVIHLAEKSDLDTIVIPADILVMVSAENDVSSDIRSAVEDTSDWLKRTKKRMPIKQLEDSDSDYEQEVMELSVEECREVASKLAQLEPDKPNILNYAWEVLKTERPNHTFFRQFASQREKLTGNSERNGIHNQARQSMARHLALSLDDTAVQRGPNYEKVRISMRGSIDGTHPRVRMQGAQSLLTGNGNESVHAEDNGPLMSHFDISAADFRRFFQNPGELSERKRIQAAELVMLYEFSGWDLPYKPEDDILKLSSTTAERNHFDSATQPLLQESIAVALKVSSKKKRDSLNENDRESADRISFSKLLPQRMIRLASVLLLTGLLMTDNASDVMYKPANMLYERRETEYIKNLPKRDLQEMLDEINSEDKGYETDMQHLKELIEQAEESGDVPTGLYDDFRKTQPQDLLNKTLEIAGAADEKIAAGMSGLAGNSDYENENGESISDVDRDTTNTNANKLDSGIDGTIGNVSPEEGGNSPLWRIVSNGEDTKGYWATGTFNNVTPDEWSNNAYGYQLIHDRAKPEFIELQQSNEIADRDDVIKVSTVQATSTQSNFSDTQRYIQIPVLEDSVPLAAEVTISQWGSNKGELVNTRVAQLYDGSFIAIYDRDMESRDFEEKIDIQYWIAPAENAPKTPYGPLHAPVPTTPGLHIKLQGEKNFQEDYGLPKADSAVDEHIANLPKDGLERTEATAQYLAENLTYKLSPFKETGEEIEGIPVTQDDNVETIPEFVDLVFENDAANCQVANTVVAASNPEDVNAASGYRNNKEPGSPYDVLSASEAHLWLVDKEGNTYDGTPLTSGLSEEEAKYFEEDFTAEDFERERSKMDETKERNDKIKRAALAFAAGAAAGYLFARRDKIKNEVKKVKESVADSRGKQAERRLNHLINTRPQTVKVATKIIEDAVFNPEPTKIATTKYDSLTPTKNTVVKQGLLIANSQRDAKTKLKKVQGNYTTPREKDAVRLAKKLLTLTDLTNLKKPTIG